jgi:hypothetical protein
VNTPRTLKWIIAGTLLSGGVAVASSGLASGTARADPYVPGSCNGLGMCSRIWCPGSPLPAPKVVWSMNACHHYYGGTVGEHGTAGGIQVGPHVIEGDPSPANTCDGAHGICLPGL